MSEINPVPLFELFKCYDVGNSFEDFERFVRDKERSGVVKMSVPLDQEDLKVMYSVAVLAECGVYKFTTEQIVYIAAGLGLIELGGKE